MSDSIDAGIAGVITGLAKSFDDETRKLDRDGLEEYWFFQWDETIDAARNTYKFHNFLKLYGSKCRRWEEMHNGSCCVVERVRDQYLMPKIREFVANFIASESECKSKGNDDGC